ncbi:hypothetical protein AB0D12_31575 [Streptomyces sp. NPDC048479]|uniref:hypothetical protein n=1 Tax=Streptomyces sp. NPDC048479 TaxID=3154725 RepID=UPI00343B3057
MSSADRRVYGVWEPVMHEPSSNPMEWWPSMTAAKSALRERLHQPGVTTTSHQRLTDGRNRPDAQFYGTPGLCCIFLYDTPDAVEPTGILDFGPKGGVRTRPAP